MKQLNTHRYAAWALLNMLPGLLSHWGAPSAHAAGTPDFQWADTRLSLFGEHIGVAVSPEGAFFASDGFGIVRSIDGGATWRTVTPFASFASGAIAIDPEDSGVMIAGRSHGLLKSIDGGQTWFELADMHAGGGARAIEFDPNDRLTVYAGVQYGWGLYKSRNGGATWTNPLRSVEVHAVAVDPEQTGVLYVGTHRYSQDPGGVLKSIDGGSTWNTIFQNPGVNTVTIDPSNPSTIYVGTEEEGVFRSSDRGNTWVQVSGRHIVAPVSALQVHPTSPSHLLAATRGQGVFHSPDRGGTWTPVNRGLTDHNCVAMAIQGQEPHTILVATYAGRAFHATIEVVPPPPPPQPQLQLRLYAGIEISGQRGSICELQYSDDLGEVKTWQKLAEMVLDDNPSLFIDIEATQGLHRLYRVFVKP